MIDVKALLMELCGDETALEPGVDLLESGLLDSFAIIELFARLEEEGVELQPTRIDWDRLRSVESLSALIREAEQNRTGTPDEMEDAMKIKKPDRRPGFGEKIESFATVTLRTSGMRGATEYEIMMKNGNAELSRYGVRYQDGAQLRVLEQRAECSEERMLRLLNDCQLLKWDGFDGPHPRGVLDGTIFRLDAVVNGGRSIRAQGSQSFPKHYRDFTDGLYAVLTAQKDSLSGQQETPL